MNEHDKLSTKEAWKELARWWKLAEVCDCGCKRMTVGPRVAGLCSALGIMKFRNMITEEQEREMLNALPTHGTVFIKGIRPYLWPTDEGGAKERAAFCIEQAKSIKEKSGAY